MKNGGKTDPRPADKPHSVPQSYLCLGDHLSGTDFSARLDAVYPRLIMERAAPGLCLTLLLVEVAWPRMLPLAPVVSYTTFSLSPYLNEVSFIQDGYLFLWPYAENYFSPDVIRHRALWSADFPQRYECNAATAWPA